MKCLLGDLALALATVHIERALAALGAVLGPTRR